MTAEFRVAGPPGTGKTTWLAKQVSRACTMHSPEAVYVISFTRAAAHELASRDLPVPRKNIGTIHAMAYRAIGSPRIAEVDSEFLEGWNGRHGHTMPVGRTSGRFMDDGGMIEAESRDAHLMAWNFHRGSLNGKRLPEPFVSFWEREKKDADVMDFTDFLLNAPEELYGAQVLMVDEAQDMTPLQWKVVRQWGSHCKTFIVVGDDDQVLYQFIGARAREFISDLPPEQTRTLARSYRLPSQIHSFSMRWIRQLGTRRLEKNFAPNRPGGTIQRLQANLDETADVVIPNIQKETGTTMILAPCAYMLKPALSALREARVAYHNPYRRSRGDWNPIQKTAGTVKAFLRLGVAIQNDSWDVIGQYSLWKKIARVIKGGLKRGGKTFLKNWEDGTIPFHVIDDLFELETLRAIKRCDLDWLENHLTKEGQPCIFPIEIARRFGVDALTEEPKIIVGTIHSVKGGEADNVYIVPDISYAAFADVQNQGQVKRDALVRQFYVAMTRAKEKLVLLQPASRYFVEGLW